MNPQVPQMQAPMAQPGVAPQMPQQSWQPQPGAPAAQPPQQAQQGSGEPEEIRNLMVNYIPTTIDEVQLRQLFEMYGPVESVKIVVDRETRTSKGYGFVKFRMSASATYAIQNLNGYPLMNKRLKVAYSQQAAAQKILSAYAGGGAMPPMQQAPAGYAQQLPQPPPQQPPAQAPQGVPPQQQWS